MTITGPFWRQRPTASTQHTEWARCYLWLNERGEIIAREWRWPERPKTETWKMSKTNNIATSWQRLQDRQRERGGQAMENHGTCPRCGATIVGKVTGPETALEDEIERLNAMLAWIDNIDPQLVDAARERFGVVENSN